MVRFGIVGGGGIAQKFARDIKLSKDAVITAVSARNPEKAEEYKKRYKVDYAFSSYEDMAKSDVIDAVYIATPHNFHFEQALLFIRYGKHVLVEKPISVNALQLEKMIAFAKHNHVLLMEAMWTHFLPSSQFVKQAIENNGYGKLIEAKLDFGYRLIDTYPKEKRLLNKDLAGGSLLDMGVYPISFYEFIEPAKTVDIKAKASMTDTGVDENCSIEINNENGANIHLRSSISETYENDAELVFEKAVIKITDFSRSSEVFINDERYFLPFNGEGFTYQIDAFVQTIKEHKLDNDIRSHISSLRTMKTMDKVRKLIGLKYPFE